MSQDPKLALQIRPADAGGLHSSSGGGSPLAAAAASSRGPLASAGTPPRPRFNGLTVSKQWVLPPRPKPGRKPKPKPEAKSNNSAGKAASCAGQGTDVTIRTPVRTERYRLSTAPLAPSIKTNKTDQQVVKDDNYMCELIGLKQSPTTTTPRKSVPSLDMILNGTSVKMDGEPLERQNQILPQRSEGRITKCSRTDPLQPVYLKPSLSVPSPLEGLQPAVDSCGFCTENTACACAEVVNSASTPPSMQSPVLRSLTGPSPPAVLPISLEYPHIAYPSFVPTLPTPVAISGPGADDSCLSCAKDAMTMLFCLSLTGAKPLSAGSVSIPCHLAFKTLQKHPRFEGCDLGMLVRHLDVSPSRQVGVQSINRVLQDLEKGKFSG